MPDRCFCETKAQPHVALDVIDPAVRPSLGLGLVRTVQPHLESHPQGHIGTHSASTGSIPPGHPRPAQSHRPGVVVETAAGPAAEMLEGFGVALDQSGGVCAAHQFRVAGPGPPQDHSEGPDAALPTVFAQNRSDCPQPALRLLPWNHLEGHRSLGLAGMSARLNVVLQNRVAPVVSQCPHFSQQHRAGLQTIPGVVVTNSVYGSSFDLCLLRSFDLRYPR